MVPALLSVPRDISPFLPSSGIRKECGLPVVAGCIPKSSRMLDVPRTGHPAWCPPTLGRAGPSDLTTLCEMPVSTLSFSFYAELCDSLSVVPSMLLPRSSSRCIFPAPGSWLQPSLLQSCCSSPNSSTWGLPHNLACILAH